MTKGAFAFIAVGLVAYLVANQTQVGWLYLCDAVIWSLLVLSAILPGYSLKSLRVEQRVLPASRLHELPLGGPTEDETVEVKLTVSNNGRFAKYFIKLVVDYPFEQPEARRKNFLLNTVKPGSATAFSYTTICYRRGHYPSSIVTLQSGGPLGLIVRRRSFQLPLNLTVYPAYYRMNRLAAVGEDWVEWGHDVKSSSASEFYGSRNYQYGDPLKHVHWRNTARVGHFMIKEFEQAQQGAVTVAFDTSRDFGTGRETTLEYSIKIAASLAKLCADSGRTIDIIAREMALHNAEWQLAMDYLARLEVTKKAIPADLKVVSQSTQAVVVIVPAVVTGQTPELARLASRGRGTVVLLEGFTADEEPDKVAALLKGSQLEIISCSPRNLEEVIDKLGDSIFWAGELSGGGSNYAG